LCIYLAAAKSSLLSLSRTAGLISCAADQQRGHCRAGVEFHIVLVVRLAGLSGASKVGLIALVFHVLTALRIRAAHLRVQALIVLVAALAEILVHFWIHDASLKNRIK
jgi:hypothetical protein